MFFLVVIQHRVFGSLAKVDTNFSSTAIHNQLVRVFHLFLLHRHFDCRAFGGRDDQEGVRGVLVDPFSESFTVLECEIIELFLSLVQQKFLPDFSVQSLDVVINSFLPVLKLVEVLPHLLDVFFHLWVLRRTNPLNFVLMEFLDIAYAFEHIRNVVNAPFLNTKLSDSIIQIDRISLALLNELDEFSCEYRKAVVLPRL